MRLSPTWIMGLFVLAALAGWLLVLSGPDEPAPDPAELAAEPEPPAPPIHLSDAAPPPPPPPRAEPPPSAPAAASEQRTEHSASQAPVAADPNEMTSEQRRAAIALSLHIPPHLENASEETQRKHFEVLLEYQEAMMDRSRETLATLARKDQREPAVQKQQEETMRQLELFKETASVLKERLRRWPEW